MNILLAIVLALHGLVHLLGFVVPWRLADLEAKGFAYTTTLLGGRVDVGAAGMRLVGVLWLLAALLFLLAALGAASHWSWTVKLILVAALLSLALCVLQWQIASAGANVNLAILAVLLLNAQFHWPSW